jgi:hypothetical protein
MAIFGYQRVHYCLVTYSELLINSNGSQSLSWLHIAHYGSITSYGYFSQYVSIWLRVAPFWFLLLPITLSSLCLSLVLLGYLWLPMAPYGSLWLPMAPYGSLILPMAPFSSLKLSRAIYFSLRLQLVPYVSMALLGSLELPWLPFTDYGFHHFILFPMAS